MGKEIALENGRISDLHGLVTLTLDRVILHTVMHHSSTSTYIPNFIKIEETFCERTDRRTFETHFIRSTRRSRSNNKTHTFTQICVMLRPLVAKLYVTQCWTMLRTGSVRLQAQSQANGLSETQSLNFIYVMIFALELLHMRLTVDSLQLTFLPSSKSRDTKTRPNIKNPAWTNLDILP